MMLELLCFLLTARGQVEFTVSALDIIGFV